MSNLSYQPNEVYCSHTSPKEYTVSTVQTRNNVTAIEAPPVDPSYSEDTQKRIVSAISKAKQSKHRAHLLGFNRRLQCKVFQVYSSNPSRAPYVLKAYDHPVLRAFRYFTGGAYVVCECEASRSTCPCWHGAKVAIRLHRDNEAIAPVEKPKPEPTYIVILKKKPLPPMHALTTEPVKPLSVVSIDIPCGLQEIFGND